MTYSSTSLRVLIDFNNICHIAKHAMGELSIDEMKTGVIFGFLGKVFQYAKVYGADSLVFCCDSKRSFRSKIFPGYKNNRNKNKKDKTDEEKLEDQLTYAQFTLLREEILPYMGFNNIFIQTGYEADDIMAYLADKNRMYNIKNSDSYVLITTDQDLYQCLWRSNGSKQCAIIFNPKTKKAIDSGVFKKKYGIEPGQWGEAKAIGGCDGDDVPGIFGAADVAKSPNSKVIKYMQGKLKSGKIFDKIESKEGQDIIKRNRGLVVLPLKYKKRIRPMRFKENEFSKEAFVDVFDKYRFLSFLKNDAFEKWEKVFKL